MGCGLLAPDLRVRFRFTGAAPFLRSFMRFCFACLGALRFAWFLSTTTAPGCGACPFQAVPARARRLPARRAVPALPRSATRSVVVVESTVSISSATWGFALRGRSSLDGGEQMHRRQDPLASFAPSGNTDKLAKLYV